MPKTITYDKLPAHMQEGARLYVERGLWPGDFLRAVLSDSLTGAFGRADEINAARIQDWARWLYNDCPHAAWGSEKAVQKWVERGGLEGLTGTQGRPSPADPA